MTRTFARFPAGAVGCAAGIAGLLLLLATIPLTWLARPSLRFIAEIAAWLGLALAVGGFAIVAGDGVRRWRREGQEPPPGGDGGAGPGRPSR
jgi:hypothetical protein